jgi:hypothetical protein
VRCYLKALCFDEDNDVVMSMEFLISQLGVLVDLEASQWRSCDEKKEGYLAVDLSQFTIKIVNCFVDYGLQVICFIGLQADDLSHVD